MSSGSHIAVIGAGIVGVSCALWLQQKGFRVTLLDGNQPGAGTSSGNACTIADYACIPVNDPGIITRLPHYLFNQESPFTLNPIYVMTHLPWMMRFLQHCRKKQVYKTIESLGTLLSRVNDGLDPLIRLTHTEDLFASNGCLYLYASQQGFDHAREKNQVRAGQGIQSRELDSGDIKDLEPGIKMDFAKGLLFEQARQVLNPQTLVTRYVKHFHQNQGGFMPHRVISVDTRPGGFDINLANQQTIQAGKVVISSGAFSKTIKGCHTEKIPLDTERGYHIQYTNQQHRITRPVAWSEAGLYATPTDQGLRFAGTVEIAGLHPRQSRKNLDYLTRKSRQMFDLADQPASTWLGFRPTLPDALPVIGCSTASNNMLYAFGHQHIGLTLAGITGKIISELATGAPPSVELSAFRPDRFC